MAYRLSMLRGMQVAAREGAAGALNDVLFGESGLRPRYVAVDQGAGFPGRRILVPATRVVLGAHGRISTDLAREALRRSISTDPRARLVSGRALCGYRVMTRDGGILHAEDLLVNPDWSLAGVVAATRDWLLPGRQVEIAAAALLAFNSEARTLRVSLAL
jgi:hypothetical protein